MIYQDTSMKEYDVQQMSAAGIINDIVGYMSESTRLLRHPEAPQAWC